MTEKWVDIKGYEGLYQISDLGRVKRSPRETLQWNHQLQKEIPVIYPMRYLKYDKIKGGYLRVTLSKGNTQDRFIVHRLVADHFLPNPENKPHVHHKNSITHDNRLVNLEWVTPIENERYKWELKQPKILAIDPNGDKTEWANQMDCARGLKLPRNGIQRTLSGAVNSYRGYKFSYIRPLGE
jgi:hypothetical protein